MEEKNIEDEIYDADILDTDFSDINEDNGITEDFSSYGTEENDTTEQNGSTGNQNYDYPSKKARDATSDTSGNFVKNNSILPKKKPRDATYDTNGNQIKNRSILPPRKARDATFDTNGNPVKNRSILPPKKARDATGDTSGNFVKNKFFQNRGKPKESNSNADLNNKFGLGRKSDDNKSKGNAIVNAIWKKLPLKVKLIIIGICAGFILLIIFIVILITPLMELGIIDIEGIGSSSNNSSYSYSSISNNTKYWWPVGSIETTTKNGVTFASGEPASMTVTSSFHDQESFRKNSHGGLDIGHGGYGSGVVPIIAARDGTVIYPTSASQVSKPDSGYLQGGGYGNYVKIQHDDGTITVYGHLYKDSVTVFAGQTVKQGQVIGKMGASGNVTGPHLHFEVITNGNKDYPLNYINSDEPRSSNVAIVGNTVKQSVCLNLKNMGIPDNGVAAILTNMQHESSFNLEAPGDYENGLPTSYGLCQWHASRRDELMSAYPDTYHTVYSQLEYLIYELENKPHYKPTYNSIMDKSKSVYDSTYTFCTNFERPKNMRTKCSDRGNASDSFAEYVYNGCQ